MDILPPPSTTAWLRRQTIGRHLTRVDELHWNFLPTFTTTRSSYVQWKNQTIAMLRMLFSPPGIAMPKGLCFTAVFFFVWHLISEVTERISTKVGHILTYDSYLKNLVRTAPDIYPLPHGLGGKNALWDRLWTLTDYISVTETWCQQSERNLSIYRDSPASPQIWLNLVQKRPRTVCEFFYTRPKFSHWDTASLTAWTLYNTQQANFVAHVM